MNKDIGIISTQIMAFTFFITVAIYALMIGALIRLTHRASKPQE